MPASVALLQKDVFTEDGFGDTEKLIRESLTPLAVEIVSDQEAMMGSERLMRHNGPFRGSLTMAQRMGRGLTYTDALNWVPALRSYLVSQKYYFYAYLTNFFLFLVF